MQGARGRTGLSLREHKTLKNEEVKEALMAKIKEEFNPLPRFKYEIIDICSFKGEVGQSDTGDYFGDSREEQSGIRLQHDRV